MPNKLLNYKSITLLEILIALLLLTTVILGFSSIDLFSRFHVLGSDRRAKLQNEVSAALEHMSKEVSRAIGNTNDWPVYNYTDGLGFMVRIDDNPENGRVDATDSWLAYRHEDVGSPAASSEIRYYFNVTNADPLPDPLPGGSTSDSVARRIVMNSTGLEFSGNWPDENAVELKVTACWDPAQTRSLCGTPDNPSVTMRTKVTMPSVSTN